MERANGVAPAVAVLTDGARTRLPRWPGWRQALPLVFLLALAVSANEPVWGLDWSEILMAAAGMPASAWATALLASLASYLAAGRYDAMVHRLLRTSVPECGAACSGMAAIAVSQAAGFGLATGTLTRWHLLPGLGLAAAARVTFIVAASFGLAWLVLTALAVVLLLPHDVPGAAAIRPMATAVLALAGAAMLTGVLWPIFRIGRHRIEAPPARLIGRLLVVAAADTLSAAFVLYAFLPSGGPSFAGLLPVFLMALGAGMVSGTPGGLGAFELIFALMAVGPDPEALASALLCYRIAYHVLPAFLALAMIILWRPSSRRGNGAPPQSARTVAERPAEAGLAGQGQLELVVLDGRTWLAGRAGQVLATLGAPGGRVDREGTLLDELARRAWQDGLTPALYKAGPRLAAAARRRGWRVLPIAEECWIRPAAFDLAARGRGGLRRKLRHAEGAGVQVDILPPGSADRLPLVEMAEISRGWASRHGGERGFSTGRFAPDLLAGQWVVLARRMGRLEAFVSFHAGADRWSLDLIRHRPDAPDGCVAALILSALGQAARQRIGCLSLASCPLPGFGLTGLAGNWAEQLAIKGGAAGLRQFKGMFAPVRTRLYLAAPTDAGVLIAAAEVARAIRWPGALPHGCSPPAAKLSALHVTADKLAFESFPRA